MFQILLKANVSAAVLRDSHGRYLLHYACRHLRSISCATKIIEALLVAHKEAAMGIDSDECYAVTTAGNHCLLVLYHTFFFCCFIIIFFTAFTLFMRSFLSFSVCISSHFFSPLLLPLLYLLMSFLFSTAFYPTYHHILSSTHHTIPFFAYSSSILDCRSCETALCRLPRSNTH